MTKTSYHIRQSIDGALHNWNSRLWIDVVFDKDQNRHLTPNEVKAYFKDCIQKGIHFIPLGDCSNFDPQHGCMGHQKK